MAFDGFNDGHCSQCAIEGHSVVMHLNGNDFWECPECRLQAHSATWGFLTILDERGIGKTSGTTATEHIHGWVLASGRIADWPPSKPQVITSEAELKAFLSGVRDPMKGGTP